MLDLQRKDPGIKIILDWLGKGYTPTVLELGHVRVSYKCMTVYFITLGRSYNP